MCHTPDSRPPDPPVTGRLGGTRTLQLTADDGAAVGAFEAYPSEESSSRIVILPDVRGLHPFYQALAERFADAGLHAIAIDYFGRTAGPGQRGEDFDWQQHVPKVTPANVRSDAAAAAEHLRASGGQRVFTVGFCFGGGNSWRLAGADIGLAGAIGFYGRPGVVDTVDTVSCPVLILAAGNDAATPVADTEAFAQRLRSAGKEVELHVYEGAPHSFFDRSFADWGEACADAWRRVLDFVAAKS